MSVGIVFIFGLGPRAAEAFSHNRLGGASAGFFLLATQIGFIVNFPAKHRATMHRFILHNLEGP